MAKASNGIRMIVSQQFGSLEIKDEHIFCFDEGLFGFEELHEFIIISEEETEPFKWLISVNSPEIGFPILSPWHLDMEYQPGDDAEMSNQVVMVIITLADNQGNMTANMKAPVILDVHNQKGKQIILPSDKFSPTFLIPKAKPE